MGGVRRGRECKRFKQRIQAEYDLKHGIAQRAAPDDATVAVLVRAIDRSNSGEFGLARLARLELDGGLAPPPWFAKKFGEPTTTLLRYAARRGRDDVASRLLRAGASATARGDGSPGDRDAVAAALADLPRGYAVWLLRRVLEKETACGCDVSEDSRWRSVVARAAAPVCPRCGAVLFGDDDDGAAPADAAASKARYAALDGAAGGGLRVVAAPARAAAAASAGRTRAARAEALWIAADRGDLLMLRGCVDAGVDVDVADEYGRTAVFRAAAGGRAAAVRALLALGADRDKSAHGGATAPHAARGDADVLAALGLASESPAPCLSFSGASRPQITRLPVPGAAVVDGALPKPALAALDALFRRLPVADESRACSERAARHYYADADGAVGAALVRALGADGAAAAPLMRFLDYDACGALPPHVDLARTFSGRRSTHTFLLYLNDCAGGETALLESLRGACLAAVAPRRGRLLVFPHDRPHEGRPTGGRKLLLRGELYLASNLS